LSVVCTFTRVNKIFWIYWSRTKSDETYLIYFPPAFFYFVFYIQVILRHIRLLWLSLLTSIERLIIVYPVIKSYFLHFENDECPKQRPKRTELFRSEFGSVRLNF
jgi:hypothetical protein